MCFFFKFYTILSTTVSFLDLKDDVLCAGSKRHSLHAVELSQRSGKLCANCVEPSRPPAMGARLRFVRLHHTPTDLSPEDLWRNPVGSIRTFSYLDNGNLDCLEDGQQQVNKRCSSYHVFLVDILNMPIVVQQLACA